MRDIWIFCLTTSANGRNGRCARVVLASSEDRAKRLTEELSSAGIEVSLRTDALWADSDTGLVSMFDTGSTRHGQDPFAGKAVLVAIGALQNGFQYQDIKLSVVCESDIEAGRARKGKVRKGLQGQKISALHRSEAG